MINMLLCCRGISTRYPPPSPGSTLDETGYLTVATVGASFLEGPSVFMYIHT